MIDRRLYILLTTGETNMYFFTYTHTLFPLMSLYTYYGCMPMLIMMTLGGASEIYDDAIPRVLVVPTIGKVEYRARCSV